jgi:vancomycin permeability regulator SanA
MRERMRQFGLFPRAGQAALLTAGVGVAAVTTSVGYVRSMAKGHIYSFDDVPAAPVGLVFGALVYPDGTPSSFLRARLDLGYRLYRSGKVGMLLVSGDHSADYDEPEAMRRYLLELGLPDELVVTDPCGFDTYDSCVRARDVYGVGAATMITQSYHLPRAVGTARAVGLDASGVGDDTMRTRRQSWITGAIRDQFACVKTVADLATDREPTLGPRTDAVRRALQAAGKAGPVDSAD